MIVSATLATLLCCATLGAGAGAGAGDGAGLLVLKCCAEDEVIDVAEEKCLKEPKEAMNRSRSPFWLPEWLRAEPGLEVEFSGIGWLRHWKRMGYGASVPRAWLDAEEPLGRRLLAVDADARRFVLEPFGHVDVRTVAGQQMCFDVTLDPRRPFVVATWLHSVALNKCCGKGARLNGRLQCRPPAVPRQPDRFPDMDFLRPLNSTPWVPGHLREAVPAIDVYYDMLREMPGAEGTMVDADDPSAWKLLFPRPHEQWGEAVWVRTDGGVEGAGTFFCLDATEAGSGLPARVLLARVAHVSKCCRRGQQLEPRAMECRVRSQTEVDARPQELLAPGDPSAYWLPRALAAEGRAVPVWYRANWDEWPLRLVFPAERARVTRFPDRPPVACVTLRRPSGREYEACASDFCFEALAGGPGQRVFAVDEFDGIEVVAVHKCCHQGQMLHVERGALGSSKIRCHPDAAEDWSPENSSLADELHPERLYVGQPLQECLAQALTLVDEEPEREMKKLVGVGFEGHFAVRFYCKDLLRDGDGGSVRDVLAFCEMPPNAELFRKVRPLHVVAAALLAVAVVAVVAQRALRTTTHGRALACHAACLMASNALQAAWFFTHDWRKSCDGFAYTIYYFLVAGAFWLNVISVNMTQGFRRPQGARSREGGGCGRRRWLLVLLYAWGLPAVFTAVCITAHQYEDEAQRRGYVTPTFFETRTCFVEYHHQSTDLQGNRVEESRKLGAVYYYYLPCGALVAVNAVCLVMTLCRIRELRRDALRLKQEPGLLQSALLYVKLLLTAGVLELGLEAAVWAFRPHVAQSRLGYYHAQHVSYVFSALGSFLDVARAAAVLWLAVGRWERARAMCRSLRDCVCRRRTVAAAAAGSPTTATATTSGSASTAETERL